VTSTIDRWQAPSSTPNAPSPIEPMLLPWPWFRGRVVIGGDAAHVFPPHLTQGAAMAAEDGYVLAAEALADDVPFEHRLTGSTSTRCRRASGGVAPEFSILPPRLTRARNVAPSSLQFSPPHT
jgi:hypothetical protein